MAIHFQVVRQCPDSQFELSGSLSTFEWDDKPAFSVEPKTQCETRCSCVESQHPNCRRRCFPLRLTSTLQRITPQKNHMKQDSAVDCTWNAAQIQLYRVLIDDLRFP